MKELLKAKPFNLNEEQLKWVYDTFENMTDEEKIGQLFSPISISKEVDDLKRLVTEYKVGGTLFRPGKGLEVQEAHRILQENTKIPLLISANLESGGTGIAIDGTHIGRQMLVGATNNAERAYQLGHVSGVEGSAVGVNWAFAPVVDIDYNNYNPITNVRTYGDSAEKVLEFAKEYVRGVQEQEVAASIKHFPGDGVDDRDQHLVTTVNIQSVEEWDKTFGYVYKSLIDEGALTVMAGHIALPSYQEKISGKPVTKVVPASLSKELLVDLLREQLGFNGLVVTDATPMVGFTSAMSRELAVPLSIENGCDMFLFNKDLEEDIKFMTQGLEKGILSRRRLEEAVLRILATKAALNLHAKQRNNSLVPNESELKVLGQDSFIKLAKEVADEGITLVKDTEKNLPVTSAKTKRVLLQILGPYEESNENVKNVVFERLTKEGFEVTNYVPENFEVKLDTVTEFKEKYDLVVYFANVENRSNATTTRLNWHTFFGQGNNIPWFVEEVPTIFVSVGNPYHLRDVPMVKTYINAYDNSEIIIQTVIDKLLGKTEFKGSSPVNPFCNEFGAEF